MILLWSLDGMPIALLHKVKQDRNTKISVYCLTKHRLAMTIWRNRMPQNSDTLDSRRHE